MRQTAIVAGQMGSIYGARCAPVQGAVAPVQTAACLIVGVISPFHSLTWILANKRRTLVRTPDFINPSCDKLNRLTAMTFTNILRDWKVFLGIALLVLLSELLKPYWLRHRQDRAQTWTVTSGQVTEAAVFRERYEVTLTLRYSYTICDEPYPIPGEFQKQFASPVEAEQWADALCDKAIPVRVNPENPWRSQLWDSELEAIVKSTGLDS